MKVGILSMQRVINYGSFLQADALKKVIEQSGHTCEFIDIIPKNKFRHGLITTLRYFYLILFCNRGNAQEQFKKRRNRAFLTQYHRMLGLKLRPKYHVDSQVTVIGSDEVFNICQNSFWGDSLQLFGEGIRSDRLISYAASFGSTTYSDLSDNNLLGRLREQFAGFHEISVRDKNSLEIVSKLRGGAIREHIDPVLVYGFEQESAGASIRHTDFIVVYGYDNRIVEKEYVEAVKKFAQNHGKKTISIGGYHDWCDINLCPSPYEVLKYFQMADYIITDTFHGTVISIKYQKQFATIIREQNQNKLSDLLEKFQLEARVVRDASTLEQVLTTAYDTQRVARVLREKQQEAEEYLKRAIG